MVRVNDLGNRRLCARGSSALGWGNHSGVHAEREVTQFGFCFTSGVRELVQRQWRDVRNVRYVFLAGILREENSSSRILKHSISNFNESALTRRSSTSARDRKPKTRCKLGQPDFRAR